MLKLLIVHSFSGQIIINTLKQNQTKTQKPKFTKQYSYQHLMKQLCHSDSASKTLFRPTNPDRNHMNGKIIYASRKTNAHVAQLNSKSTILFV